MRHPYKTEESYSWIWVIVVLVVMGGAVFLTNLRTGTTIAGLDKRVYQLEQENQIQQADISKLLKRDSASKP